MKVPFFKMHGIGNDYIYFDEALPDPAAVAIKLSDRHFSVGGDGIVLILPSEIADAKMRMFNADGSEGKMCGNAIRCVGKYLYEIKDVKKTTLTVETLSGIKTLTLHTNGGRVEAVTADMGAPFFVPDEIPALFAGEKVVGEKFIVGGKTYFVTCLSMGNPHCVVFGGDPDKIALEKIGPQFENHPAFPERVNTEFVQVVGRNELKMRVWERGSGETLACGTGACAAAVAAVVNGRCDKDADITVHLLGGDLTVRYTGDAVYMTGPAQIAFLGVVEI